VLAALRGTPGPHPPSTLSTTLEFDATGSTITSRHWPRHPRCAC
jgi:hypothetical protein